MPKFFVRQDAVDQNKITIVGDDAFHISRALRMAKGERITVCDMQRNEYDCVLSEFNQDNVVAEIISTKKIDNEPLVKTYLFQALPKGDKLDTVIQKSVECGVFEITPFESERCVAKSKPDAEARKTERRNRIALEAAKQCGRGYVPAVNPTVSFETAIEKASECDLCIFCYEGEENLSLKELLRESRGVESIAVFIGSEGGFSLDEVKRASERGMKSVSLGKRILRTETASGFVLGCIVYETEL
jgi:16S rRNA (uracil1498-N3)-methyltransferase